MENTMKMLMESVLPLNETAIFAFLKKSADCRNFSSTAFKRSGNGSLALSRSSIPE